MTKGYKALQTTMAKALNVVHDSDAFLKELAYHWEHHFDWQKAEDKINSYKNYKQLLNGIDVHFMHARSPDPNAIPLIFIHGWPGSFVEAFKIIGMLTNPGKSNVYTCLSSKSPLLSLKAVPD